MYLKIKILIFFLVWNNIINFYELLTKKGTKLLDACFHFPPLAAI